MGPSCTAESWAATRSALGVVPQRGQVLAQVSVVGPQGHGVSGLHVQVNDERASACGSGCYRTTLTGNAGERRGACRATTLARAAPGGVAAARRARCSRRQTSWRALHSLSYHETLASDSAPDGERVADRGARQGRVSGAGRLGRDRRRRAPLGSLADGRALDAVGPEPVDAAGPGLGSGHGRARPRPCRRQDGRRGASPSSIRERPAGSRSRSTGRASSRSTRA